MKRIEYSQLQFARLADHDFVKDEEDVHIPTSPRHYPVEETMEGYLSISAL